MNIGQNALPSGCRTGVITDNSIIRQHLFGDGNHSDKGGSPGLQARGVGFQAHEKESRNKQRFSAGVKTNLKNGF